MGAPNMSARRQSPVFDSRGQLIVTVNAARNLRGIRNTDHEIYIDPYCKVGRLVCDVV